MQAGLHDCKAENSNHKRYGFELLNLGKATITSMYTHNIHIKIYIYIYIFVWNTCLWVCFKDQLLKLQICVMLRILQVVGAAWLLESKGSYDGIGEENARTEQTSETLKAKDSSCFPSPARNELYCNSHLSKHLFETVEACGRNLAHPILLYKA